MESIYKTVNCMQNCKQNCKIKEFVIAKPPPHLRYVPMKCGEAIQG
ncbi:MAG: hypothetical protein LBM98_04675 [Oscillospiraceae bacterium]|nr:hypothetical protein [Oscillospiraceae bacterium]